MAKAETVTPQEWQLAMKIKDNHTLFNFLSRSFVARQPLPAQKLHVVEFFAKP